jgi:membrane protease YdiL (CAAX protease family)
MEGLTRMHARTLSLFAIVVLVLNAVAAGVAVAFNWPAQFGGVGTDAGAELIARGTAISAPLLPVVFLLLVAALARARSRWAWVALAAGYLTAASVFIGGLGELLAQETVDTPRLVLTVGGVAWIAVPVILAMLTTLALVERLRWRASGRMSARA